MLLAAFPGSQGQDAYRHPARSTPVFAVSHIAPQHEDSTNVAINVQLTTSYLLPRSEGTSAARRLPS